MGSDVGQIFPTASLHRDHSILYALVCENKSILHMYCCGTRKSHPRTWIISSETRLPSFWRNYSGPRVGFPCPTTINHDGYFFSPTLWLFKVLYDFCQFRISFQIFCVCSNLKNKFTNEFSRCRNGCKDSLAPKNGSEIAFQASVLFFWDLKLTLVSVSIDKDVVAPNFVNNVRHIVVAF